MTKKETHPTLSDIEVINWLKKNKDFLNKNPEVYDFLTPPKDTSQGKGIVDFQHYMVKRLKSDREDILESAKEIVETSRANMSNQARVQQSILMLLDAADFEDFIRIVTMDITSVLGVDIVTMLVESEGDVIPHIDISGVRAIPQGSIDVLMDKKPIALHANIDGLYDVFGGGAGLVKSQAFVRIDLKGGVAPVMLAFGSRDPELFQAGQGTDLIAFLGGVVQRCFSHWLDLPR